MKSLRPGSAWGEGRGNGPGEPAPPGRSREADFRNTQALEQNPRLDDRQGCAPVRKGRRPGEPSLLSRPCADGEPQQACGGGAHEPALAQGGATLGADKGYDAEAFVEGLKARGIEPHVAINGTVSKHGPGAQDRGPERGRRERAPRALDLGAAAAQAHRGRLRLDEDGRRPHAGEGVRPRQGPRRFRLRHGRLQHRPPAQAYGRKGRTASGGIKSQRTMTRRHAKTSNMRSARRQKIAPAPPVAQTQ